MCCCWVGWCSWCLFVVMWYVVVDMLLFFDFLDCFCDWG